MRRPSRFQNPSTPGLSARRWLWALLTACVFVSGAFTTAGSPHQADTLSVYFVDVEGGQATLMVTPDRQSLLVDAGYGVSGRDSGRIVEAMSDAGVSQIDRLVVTH